MISVYRLKPAFQQLLRPLTAGLARAGFTANQVTLWAVALCAVWAVATRHLPVGPALLALPFVLALRMALNAMDGLLAREHGQRSRLGGALNELGDVLGDLLILVPFALLLTNPADIALTLIIAVIALLTEFAGMIGPAIGSERRYDGPFGKSDRALFFSGLAVALAFGLPGGLWLSALLGGAALAGVVTVVLRISRAVAQAEALS